MYKSFKFRIYLSKEQTKLLKNLFGYDYIYNNG